jgi:hypothetical protein
MISNSRTQITSLPSSLFKEFNIIKKRNIINKDTLKLYAVFFHLKYNSF